jgi:hypothetical protein
VELVNDHGKVWGPPRIKKAAAAIRRNDSATLTLTDAAVHDLLAHHIRRVNASLARPTTARLFARRQMRPRLAITCWLSRRARRRNSRPSPRVTANRGAAHAGPRSINKDGSDAKPILKLEPSSKSRKKDRSRTID